jgi:hypothetical protein
MNKLTVHDWAQHLLRYEDGRFDKDKFFPFFVLNYLIRRRNQETGNFFINKIFSGQDSITLDDIKSKLDMGDNAFLKEISYFSKKIKGSNAYWRSKREELNTWINHHIEMGNGAPNYFGTLSCAEYHWPDILRLVEERIFIETGTKVHLKDNKHNRVQVMNDYAAVVQEYFQLRVKKWFDTVGKKSLKLIIIGYDLNLPRPMVKFMHIFWQFVVTKLCLPNYINTKTLKNSKLFMLPHGQTKKMD